jgi:transmembrane sensor
MSEDSGLSTDQLLQEAATWFARMRGPDAEAGREAFEAWLRRGALHRQAYNRAAEIFAMGKMLAEDERAIGDVAVTDARPAVTWERWSKSRLFWASVAAMLLLVTAGWLALAALPFGRAPDRVAQGKPLPAQPAERLLTGAGETRSFRLADGSVVMLAGASLVELRMGPGERRLDLLLGRARFQVFHEPRPFVVHAGGGRVTARGTLFEMGLSAGRRVTVRLIEGAVDVRLPPAATREGNAPRVRRLRPGEALTYGAAIAQGPVIEAAAGADTAPASPAAQRPAQDHVRASVDELVTLANRGAARPIRLADAAIGRRLVSGHFRVDDTMRLAERLAALFDLSIESGHGREIVLRAR